MESIIIRNFGPISELEITLKKVNVFIGEQGVGKSTLAKLLSCCRDFVLYFLIVNDRPEDDIMTIFKMYGIHDYFKENTYIEYHDNKLLNLKYLDGRFEVTHDQFPKSVLKQCLVDLLSVGIKSACNILGIPIVEKLTNEDLERILLEKGTLVVSNLRTSFYCPAERGTASILSNSLASILLSNIPLPRPLVEYMSFFEKARQEYPSFKIPFLNLSYAYENGKDIVMVNGAPVQLEYASSGIQSILPLLMVIEYCMQNGFFSSFTIEEPELNLFPTNQLHLLQTLIAKTNSENCKLGSWTITTHSPYLLSVFNISLLAGRIAAKFPEASKDLESIINPVYIIRPDEISVYELTTGGNNASCCKSILDDNTGLIKSNYLDSVSDIISSDFNQLYKLYVKLSREAK